MKILVVEDDLLVADALKITLADQKYAVEIAHDGQAGLDFIEAFDYDLLLLDAILPKLDGISLCRHVRSRGYMMPILLLTSLDSNHDRAIGLDAGADDYVVKPFDPEELSARIRALLRRGNDRTRPVLIWEDLTLDPRNYEVTYQQQLLNLTPKEYALLELFLRYSRRLFSCGAILEHLWTYEDAPSEEAVRTHIKGLRHKLKAAGAPTDFVETVYGIGYRLKAIDPAPVDSVNSIELDLNPDPITAKKAAPIDLPVTHRPATPAPVAADPLDFLTAIWNRHYPEMLDRVASIDRVLINLTDRSFTPEIRHQAWQSAHTLAGSLGTFGLTLGSKVAKQIELLLAGDGNLTTADILQLQTGVDCLHQEIASKMPKPEIESQPEPKVTSEIATPPQYRSPWLLMITQDTDLEYSLNTAQSSFEIVRSIAFSSEQLTQTPAAIILDLDCFPQLADGLMALSALDRDYPSIPAIVLSQPTTELDPAANIAIASTSSLQQRIEVARLGARLFLTKPLVASQILAAVDRVWHQAHLRQAKVMIVDDDPLLLEGVSALLSRKGMKVTILADPGQFWETLEAATPDLLILDLDMPTHDGIELCRAVRTDPQWVNLPILFLTAHTAAFAVDRVFAAGADDFVAKPVVAETLITRVFNRLNRSGWSKG
jgi:DNA-binding response OmpR family regulator/HPt (histidine-containing phosphotransfer) domain-containing protein